MRTSLIQKCDRSFPTRIPMFGASLRRTHFFVVVYIWLDDPVAFELELRQFALVVFSNSE